MKNKILKYLKQKLKDTEEIEGDEVLDTIKFKNGSEIKILNTPSTSVKGNRSKFREE